MDSCRFLSASSLALCLRNSISRMSVSLSRRWFSPSLRCNFNSSRCLCRSKSSSLSCLLLCKSSYLRSSSFSCLSNSCCHISLCICSSSFYNSNSCVFNSNSFTLMPAAVDTAPPSTFSGDSGIGVKVSTRRKYLTTHYGPSQILHPHHTPPSGV